MAQSLARISGEVLNVDQRSGTSKKTGEKYEICNVLVLVAQSGVAEVSMPKGVVAPKKGDYVDFLVSTSVYNNEVQMRAVDTFPVALAG